MLAASPPAQMAAVSSSRDEPKLAGALHRLQPPARTNLVVDLLHVPLDRSFRHAEFSRDFSVAHAGADQAQYFALFDAELAVEALGSSAGGRPCAALIAGGLESLQQFGG